MHAFSNTLDLKIKKKKNFSFLIKKVMHDIFQLLYFSLKNCPYDFLCLHLFNRKRKGVHIYIHFQIRTFLKWVYTNDK